VAGGSKASIKLFHDLLQVKSNAARVAETKTTVTANKKRSR
jgi:hypothetical protein